MTPKKQEVYFLPFRASVWKNMESVWSSMSSNSDCNVHVVPIPYFDRDENGEARSLFFEGNDLPDYVPIEDYRKVNFEQLHPDVICIQYPFDGQNIRNGISPRFYAETLCEQTDQLIYIPYFTEMDDMPAEFCTCPAVEYSHRVILQTECGRSSYLVHYHDYLIERGIMGEMRLDEKFLVMSGKSAQEEEPDGGDLPEAWQKRIVEESGMRRKVILYSTTAKAFMQSPEETMSKIESVLREFAEDQSGDVILWWRPEPRLQEVIASYSDEMLEHFRELVRDFKTRGIYDDTADLNRALRESDAYYGDWSSLVPIYEISGRPVVIQNVLYKETSA